MFPNCNHNTPTPTATATAKRKEKLSLFFFLFPFPTREKWNTKWVCLLSFVFFRTRWHLVRFPVSLVIIMPCWDLVPHWSFSLSVSSHVLVLLSLLAVMSVFVTFHSHCLSLVEQCGFPRLRRSWNLVRESFQLLGRDAIGWVSLWPKVLPFLFFVENVFCFAEWGLFIYTCWHSFLFFLISKC